MKILSLFLLVSLRFFYGLFIFILFYLSKFVKTNLILEYFLSNII